MRKFKTAVVVGVITGLILTNSVFAFTNNQETTDKANSSQEITQQSKEEINCYTEKTKDAEKLIKSIKECKSNKITKYDLNQVILEYNKKYKTNINSDQIPTLKSTDSDVTTLSAATTTSDSSVLGYACSKQLTDWYCGPASAYNILKGMGVSSYGGKTLSQDNLASDLGALTSGASFPGTWTSTLNNWSGKYYISVWGPSASSLLANAYVDTIAYMGTIYDTYMSGSNQLYGYSVGTTRYHYLAGDGYNNTTSEVHYLDSHNTNVTAFGAHWATSSLMASCVSSRGMIW